eukprot:6192114-Prymnesium_polylepis.1
MHMFQFYMKEVIGDIQVQELGDTTGERTAIIFTMRRPSKLFRLDEALANEHGYSKESAFDAEQCWIRTTDPTPTSALGGYL